MWRSKINCLGHGVMIRNEGFVLACLLHSHCYQFFLNWCRSLCCLRGSDLGKKLVLSTERSGEWCLGHGTTIGCGWEHIFKCASLFWYCNSSLWFIPHDGNKVAHNIASYAFSFLANHSWVDCIAHFLDCSFALLINAMSLFAFKRKKYNNNYLANFRVQLIL